MSSIMDYSFSEDLISPIQGPDHLQSAHLETSSRILAVLKRYRLGGKLQPTEFKEGELKFEAQICTKVAAGEPILMCLPAFPFKSPNTTSKVLGRLPDKAEEFALAHLNGLCAAIGDVYPPGAQLTIVSDGLVYNDLLGVPDRDVWAYGEALRCLSVRQKCSHIGFCRLKHLVHIDVPDELDEMTYVANATNFRHGLLKQFSKPGFDASLRISQDDDTCLTYRGYIKFLETDLRYVYPVGPGRTKSKYKKGIEYIAKQMLNRGDAFARAVRERFPDRIRLSIHPSCGMKKLSVSLLPTDSCFTTPWHCSIAFRLDGSITTGHSSDFDTNAQFEKVYEDGRPSFYRERSNLVSWATEKGGITCTPVYPTGWLIRPAKGLGALSILDIDTTKVRTMAELSSPIILRDFSRTRNREFIVRKAEDFGRPLRKLSSVPKVNDQGTDTQRWDKVLSIETTKLSHQYGMPKIEELRVNENESEELASPPSPRFQILTAPAASPKDTRVTIFSSSSLVLKYFPRHIPLDYLRTLNWGGFGDLPLVVDHPSTETPCLPYHEFWCPHSKTRSSAAKALPVDHNTGDMLDPVVIREVLDGLLHDRRVAYHHEWAKGDLVVNDNMVATKKGSGSGLEGDGELWMIQFD